MLAIKVNNIDRTKYVIWKSFRKVDSLNNSIDVCSFSTRNYGTKSWKPKVDDEIEVLDDSDTIFAGNIVFVTEKMEGAKIIRYDVECKDWTYQMDKNLVFDTYEGEEIADIVRAIVSNYCSGFTATPIAETGVSLEYMLFNYEQPSKCIQQLAEMIGYDWYVDCDKNVHFFSKATGEAASFGLTDENGNYVFKSLTVTEDDSQLKNSVFVRGGEYVGNSREDKVGVGDGVTKIFKLPYRYDSEGEFPAITKLLAYWSFSEGSGATANDGSGHGNIGTLIDMEEADWVVGIAGTALDFDGVNDYVELGDNFPEVTNSGIYSISLWFNTALISTNGTLINICPGESSSDRNGINIVSSCIQAGYWNGVSYVGKKTVALGAESENVWVHIVMVNTAGIITLYVNSVEQDISGIDSLNQENHIGQNTSQAFNGKIDEVRIYNTALTAKEVYALYKNPAGAKVNVDVGGVTKTVGVDYLDSEDDYDCLWGYMEKLIKFKTAPASGNIRITGRPLILVIIKAKRSSSIAAYGECKYVIVDKTIKTKSSARQRAEAEFEDYAVPIKEASFLTTKSGLRSGQKISIQSDIRNLDQNFIINRVRTICQGPTEGFYYQVDASTSRPLGIIRFLQKQLELTNKKVGVFRQEGEVLDIIVDLEEIDTITISEILKINDEIYKVDLETIDTMTVSESLLRVIKDSPPTWVYGSYSPTNDADRKRPAFFDRGCYYAT